MALYHSTTTDVAGRDRLWDYREADLTGLSAEDLETIVKFVEARSDQLGNVRVGMLVAREVDFGISRQYGAVAGSSYGARFGVFRDEADAIAWMEHQP